MDNALYLVRLDQADPKFANVRRVLISRKDTHMDASVRFEFSHGTVWREARWSFVFPTTELNFRTYPHLEGEGHEIPEDFAPALAGKLGYEFPKDVEPSRLALPAYQGGLPSSRRRRIKPARLR